MRIVPLLVFAAAGGAALAGCAAHPEPFVDMQGVDPVALAADWEDCEGYAAEVRPARGVARGAVAGAAVGAAAGAISGDADRGAGYGGIAGAARSGVYADRTRQAVFKRCLRVRGYRVLN